MDTCPPDIPAPLQPSQPAPPHLADALALLAETRCITSGILGPQASGIRSWFTWTPRCWRIRPNPGSQSWRTGRAFPRERRSGWGATRAGW